MKIIVAIALLIFTSIIACRKNNTTNDFSSRIIGKWKFNSVIEWWTPRGGPVFGKDTFDVTNLGQQYREFRNDGKVYSLLSLFGSFYNDTTDYKINGNVIIISENKTPILRDTGIIQTLANNTLVIYHKVTQITPPGIYDDWFNYSK